ncbi:GTP 3',8-cyclase MoaA [Algiphilus aromaticivorans]|uniref:GTP 3',8-cyclase MoaA n=1 Tax=Algiphilus aromaticivorans TaxID=382454 RepID=UPI0005C25529|nr:GTP 3',8-cyclase MoaA [Algiphilus aromaticivorans]
MDEALKDQFGRRFAYLRLSITDVCNFRCEYCLPDGYQGTPRGFLGRGEIQRLIGYFARLGIRKLRLTGGEPLVRRDVLDIVRDAAATPGIERLAMTTNGYRLVDLAQPLREAGLDAINISLDSLDSENFERITGDRRHVQVMAGVEAALATGFEQVKINTVLLRGLNDFEVADFVEYVRERALSVRFIELMRTRDNSDYFDQRHVRALAVAQQLEADGWTRYQREATDGPAIEFSHPDYAGRIGFITPYAAGFCDGCNRLRVTARGGLRLCLFGDGTRDLRPLLQDDAQETAFRESVFDALFHKTAGHRLHEGDYGDTPHLAMTGG